MPPLIRWVGFGLLSAALLSLGLLYVYRLELVHLVVQKAVIQKAPPEVEVPQIEETFAKALASARGGERQEEYLKLLFRIAQELERIPHLSGEETRAILIRVENYTRSP